MSDYNLIIHGLQEIVGQKELRDLATARIVKVYWGTAPTGRIHIGYFLPMLKIAQLLQANCGVTILIADLHAMLDNLKSTPEQIEYRTIYYIKMIRAMLESLHVDLTRIRFIRGTEFQLMPQYTMDVYKINTLCTLNDAKHAGAEVVKQSSNPLMTSLLYPTLQALDEEYLQVDAQLGGIDQRKIFMFAREYLPKIGYHKRIHLMTKMIPGLRNQPREQTVVDEDVSVTQKMSASDERTKIDLLDNLQTLRKKINSAYCVVRNITDNSVLELLGNIIFPLLEMVHKPFTIDRKPQHGGPITFTDFNSVNVAFAAGELHPADLKLGVVNNLNAFLEPVRVIFNTPENIELLKKAYAV